MRLGLRKHTNDRLQGTLDLLVLKTLASRGRMHGYGITLHVERVSGDALRIEEGSLYPALHRMTQCGWLKAKWGASENKQRALLRHYYCGAKATRSRREELGGAHGRGTQNHGRQCSRSAPSLRKEFPGGYASGRLAGSTDHRYLCVRHVLKRTSRAHGFPDRSHAAQFVLSSSMQAGGMSRCLPPPKPARDTERMSVASGFAKRFFRHGDDLQRILPRRHGDCFHGA